MKALVLTAPNLIEITEKPKPAIAAGEALIKVKAAALNHRDQWIRIGKYAGIQIGVTLGSDGAGLVEAVGSSEDAAWIGKNVIINPARYWGANPAAQSKEFQILGMPNDGTFAEYIALPLDRLHPKPDHLSWAEAAALPLGGLTAYRALFTQGKVSQGQKVLINGIGGGVAQWAFLFAQAAGAKLWVSSSSDEKLAAMAAKGALGGFNYRKPGWTAQAKEAAQGFDLIIDSAGGNGLNELLDVVRPGGRIVLYGATAGVPEQLNLRKIFWNQVQLLGSTMGTDAEFSAMVEWVNRHQIRPIMEEPFAFQDIIKAFDQMQEGRQFGKLAVEF